MEEGIGEDDDNGHLYGKVMPQYTLSKPYISDGYSAGPTTEHQTTRCRVHAKVATPSYIIPSSRHSARDVAGGVEVLSGIQAKHREGGGGILCHLEGRVEELRGRREDMGRRQVATREAARELVDSMVGVATDAEVVG